MSDDRSEDVDLFLRRDDLIASLPPGIESRIEIDTLHDHVVNETLADWLENRQIDTGPPVDPRSL